MPQYSWIAEAEAKVSTVGALRAVFFGGMKQADTFGKIRPRLAEDVRAKFAAANAGEWEGVAHKNNAEQAAEPPPTFDDVE